MLTAPLPHDREADAELIVRAVNAFDALLAVAKAGQDWEAAERALAALDAAHPDWRDWP